jgi:hypothetical protein
VVDVAPVDRAGWTGAPPAGEADERLRSVLGATCRYALGPWWAERGHDRAPQGLLTFPGNPDDVIRPPCAVALGLACAAATGAVTGPELGLPPGEVAGRAVRLSASLAHAHASSFPGGWGLGWQTPMWAAYVGLAAWLHWEAIAPEHRPPIVAMLEAEADAVAAGELPHYRDRDGVIRFPGDTKAEETSWRARVLHLVTVMLPRHPRRRAWTEAALAFLISAYARPSDVVSEEVLHGRPLRDWLAGSNIEDSGLLVNHGRIHPDYLTVPHHAAAALHHRLAGRPVPRAALHNLDLVYAALADGHFRPDGSVIYPEGATWGSRRRIHFLLNDVQARVLGTDWRSEQGAATWERLHAEEVLAMIARSEDGRVYVEPDEFTSAQREEEALERAGQAYLFHRLGEAGRIARTNAPVDLLVVP